MLTYFSNTPVIGTELLQVLSSIYIEKWTFYEAQVRWFIDYW